MNSSGTEGGDATDPVTEARRTSRAAVWLNRAIIFWLFAFALFAPHSIAATQIAWSCALLCWVARFFFRPRPPLFRTPVDYALLGFFILTFASSLLSYEQNVSIGKLRAASLFTIVYLVAENVTTKRLLRALTLTLIVSCMINVFYTIGSRAIGQGVKVEGVTAESPLSAARYNFRGQLNPFPIQSGDTLLEVDGHELRRPEELVAALDGLNPGDSRPAFVKIYRGDNLMVEVPRGQLRDGATTSARLGIESWSRGRDWRAAGFYGHYVTYAEVLQLIASLTLGLFIALGRRKHTLSRWLLGAAVAGLGIALLLTVTRASWLAFLISAFVIMLVGTSRRTVILVLACAVPIILAGLFVLQQKRHVGFFDQQDQSITWRETVWREGFQLLKSKPRHLLVGVGMDSIKSHWREWGLFDNGNLLIGHMHSTPLQLALERGIPALLVWASWIVVYAFMLWRLLRSGKVDGWIERGLLLGALGGLIGFITSGLVHYNFGDSEVVTVFYFIMGLSLVVERQVKEGSVVMVANSSDVQLCQDKMNELVEERQHARA